MDSKRRIYNAKIILTLNCNRACEFCFQEPKSKKFVEMSISNFELLLHWLKMQQISDITLLGGEPSLHTEFKNILELSEKFNMKITILTNLLFPTEKIISYLKNVKRIAANIALIDDYSRTERKQIYENLSFLEKLNIPIILCSTIYKKNQSIDSIIDLANQFKNIQNIRLDLARPSINKINTCILSDEIFSYKFQFISYIDKIEKNCLSVILDCPLPKCFFTSNEIKKYDLYSKGLSHNSCGSLFVINPDLSIGVCPFFHITEKKINEFQSSWDVECYLSNKLNIESIKYPVKTYEQCLDCQNNKDKSCSGYCLAEKAVETLTLK
jgi:radical SAM protein with 4Fe4S-binding SPASM domain